MKEYINVEDLTEWEMNQELLYSSQNGVRLFVELDGNYLIKKKTGNGWLTILETMDTRTAVNKFNAEI